MINLKISKKNDLRVQKTYTAFYDALVITLNRRNFNDITVNDLCAEALVSRPTFYVYFNDKYDLLKHFLTEVKNGFINEVYSYEEVEHEVHQFIYSNKKLITNIFKNANNETLKLIREFISSIVELMIKRRDGNGISPNHITLLNFCIGGYENMFKWAVDNNFPPEFSRMMKYLYRMLQAITIWDEEHEVIQISVVY